MAGAMTAAGLQACADSMRDHFISANANVHIGPCTSTGTYIGVAASGYTVEPLVVTGPALILDCAPYVETVVKSDATYQFRQLEVRLYNAAFKTGALLVTLARTADIQFDYGGKVILKQLEIAFSV